MDLATTLPRPRLPHPFMPGASPLVDDLDTCGASKTPAPRPS
jgi:hypothetical protein